MDDNLEIIALRNRLHDLAELMHTYRLAQVIQDTAVKHVKDTVEHIQRTTATADRLDSFKGLCERDFKALSEDIASIHNSISWGVRLVLGAVILSIIAVILKGNITP